MINWTTSLAVMFILLYAQSLIEQRRLRKQRDQWEELYRKCHSALVGHMTGSSNAIQQADELIELLRKGP